MNSLAMTSLDLRTIIMDSYWIGGTSGDSVGSMCWGRRRERGTERLFLADCDNLLEATPSSGDVRLVYTVGMIIPPPIL